MPGRKVNTHSATKGKKMTEKQQQKQVQTYMETSIASLTKVLPHIFAQRLGVLLRGPHGIGKSELAQELAKILPKYLGIDDEIDELKLIDRRLSQCPDAGDITGLPAITTHDDGNNITDLNPMAWFYDACVRPCLLLFDELDRAQPDVKQAVFEVGDSRKIAGHKLHKNTVVMACTNGGVGASAQYMVKKMDPAELDRWACFEFRPTIREWIDWAKRKNENGEMNVKSDIIQFIEKHSQHLEFNGDIEPNRIYPSRRSWKRFSDALPQEWIETKEPEIMTLAYSFVGFEAASRFTSYIEKQVKSINIEDVIRKGDLSSCKDCTEPKFAEACNKMAMLNLTTKKMTHKHLDNLLKFVKTLPEEIFAMFWKQWGFSTNSENIQYLMTKDEWNTLLKNNRVISSE